jgi:hypothetical protein
MALEPTESQVYRLARLFAQWDGRPEVTAFHDYEQAGEIFALVRDMVLEAAADAFDRSNTEAEDFAPLLRSMKGEG